MEYLDDWHEKGKYQQEEINAEGFDPKTYEQYKNELVDKYYGEQKEWTEDRE